MKKFLVLYRAPAEAMAQTADSSPEEQAEGMKEWMVWSEKVGNKLVDMGNPLTNALKVMAGGKTASGDNSVVGFSILQAETKEDAAKLMDGHPHLGWNAACDIQIHEIMPLPRE